MSKRDLLADFGYDEGFIVFDSPDYDEAIIGVTTDNCVVYDFNLMVQHLMEMDGITDIEAIEFIEYNTIRSLPYVENAPVIMYGLEFF